jgi:HEAT repeat protein
VGAALAAFQDFRKDVFAPELMPVAVRADSVLASGARAQLVDALDRALFLAADSDLDDALASALEEVKLRAVLGDVGLDAALPTLFAAAVVIETPEGLELRPLVKAEKEEGISRLKRRPGAGAPRPALDGVPRNSWTDAARSSGASRAAVALAEVRDELAEKLANGLPSLTTRSVEAIVERLKDLSLEKPAAVLEGAAAKAQPDERLEDVVRVYQVLGIALVRLAGALQIDRRTLVSVVTHPSVQVRRPDPVMPPDHVLRRRRDGTMSRFDAAAHLARHYEQVGVDALLDEFYPSWADGSASAFVAKALATKGTAAIAAAERASSGDHSQMVRRTAIRVLLAVGDDRSGAVLERWRDQEKDGTIRGALAEAIQELRASRRGADAVRQLRALQASRLDPLAKLALAHPSKDERLDAVDQLRRTGSAAARVPLRRVLLADPVRQVRRRAAMALAGLGDSEVLDQFALMIEWRGGSDEDARDAAYALGYLGDVRGVEPLLAAFVDSWKPTVISEALRALGLAVMRPVVALVEAHPQYLERKALISLFGALPAREIARYLCERASEAASHPDVAARCSAYLKLASATPFTAKEVAARVLEIPAAVTDKNVSRFARRLAKGAR